MVFMTDLSLIYVLTLPILSHVRFFVYAKCRLIMILEITITYATS